MTVVIINLLPSTINVLQYYLSTSVLKIVFSMLIHPSVNFSFLKEPWVINSWGILKSKLSFLINVNLLVCRTQVAILSDQKQMSVCFLFVSYCYLYKIFWESWTNVCLSHPENQGQTKKMISCELLNQWASLDYLQECGYLKAADHQNALHSMGDDAWKLHP